MSTHTRIEWADSTWNPVMGCTPVSEGCDNCYARSNIARFAGKKGWPESVEAGVTLFPERLEQPLHWKEPRRIFVCSMADIFHDDVPAWYIDRILEVISACPQHSFMLLTKRAENIERKLFGSASEAPIRDLGGGDCLPNMWLGVTAENQARANERIPALLAVPAAVHFVSIEPMLEPMTLTHLTTRDGFYNALEGCGVTRRGFGGQSIPNVYGAKVDWVIVGGESGVNARPMRPDWVRRIRDECQLSGTPWFFKQWGEWISIDDIDQEMSVSFVQEGRQCGGELMFRVGRKHAGRLLDDRKWGEFPQHGEARE